MKNNFKIFNIVFFVTFGLFSIDAFSQREIRVADQMYKKRLLRRLDLREKANKPMFSEQRWITKVMLEAFTSGQLIAYRNDSLTSTQTQEEVDAVLSKQMAVAEDTLAQQLSDDSWGDDSTAAEAPTGPEKFFPKDLDQLELTEDIIFDKQHSRMYFNILSLTLIIPASKNEAGIDKPVCTFDYKELAAVFADKEKAEWYNRENDAMHLSLKDAFDLRLFSSFIIMISNAKAERLVDKYGGDERVAIRSADWVKQQLVEYEHHLWSL
ncbi:MAG: hypothetical protein A3H98_00020 [Bacteroidetes bacterium RIFCSPLOWO2_02_FULL_36_8]|nr:MAG: hypothetical protein A3H98_00020 [Bacteroidetes bacterium RIFCSPLOWO2_02_FULL_36_8]OFY69911.1 MAG: hypothetical protein A3G23_05480 [Bacteroidetes bacterium RIFCSPLOWO2_12_FULL_37_12]